MSANVISTLTLNGVEKLSCAHGNWITIAHAAHLTGNHVQLMKNASLTIQHLLKRHSRMRTRLRIDGNQYFLDTFEYNSEHLLSDSFFSIIRTDNYTWQEIVEYQCNQDPYSHDGTIAFPLFHFMLLFDSQRSSEIPFHLILFENHCVSDGRSGFTLINDFLTMATTPNLEALSEPVSHEVYPLVSQMISRPYGPFYRLASYLYKRKLQRDQRNRPNDPRIPVKSIPLVDCQPSKFSTQRYKLKFLFASTSTELYSRLHEHCHLRKVTLNGPLVACLLLAIHHCFPINKTTHLKPFGVSITFDMRPRLRRSPLTPSSVGFFACGNKILLRRSFPLKSTRFWSLVHECMLMTRKSLKRTGIPLRMSTLTDILQSEAKFNEFTQNLPEGRRSELAFSNIGKYPFSCDYGEGEIRLRGLHVVNNSSVYRFSTVLFLTCAGDGQFDLSLAHEMESDEKAREFLDCYIHLIELCADQSYCGKRTTLEQLLDLVESNRSL